MKNKVVCLSDFARFPAVIAAKAGIKVIRICWIPGRGS